MSAKKRIFFSLTCTLFFLAITCAISTMRTHVDIKGSNMWTHECELVVQRPEEMTGNCADFGVLVRKITWDQWSDGRAFGTGIYSENDCEPSCAQGSRHEMPVTVELGDVRKVGSKYFLTTFSFSSQPGEDLPGTTSPDGSWTT